MLTLEVAELTDIPAKRLYYLATKMTNPPRRVGRLFFWAPEQIEEVRRLHQAVPVLPQKGRRR